MANNKADVVIDNDLEVGDLAFVEFGKGEFGTIRIRKFRASDSTPCGVVAVVEDGAVIGIRSGMLFKFKIGNDEEK